MRYLSIGDVLDLYLKVMRQSGGGVGIRDLNALESCVAQPRMTFGDNDLYPSLVEKATALSYSLVMNHPFIDGNKRIGHAALDSFLILNGFELDAGLEEQVDIFLQLAAGKVGRDEFTSWLNTHVREKQ